ncbi:NAD(P)/FAD-dependent oxidoreductase [soil metagenome]
MTDHDHFDVAIIGGGLAGLTLSIQLCNAGYSVILFEKEKYPFHKVCGEYISNESRKFLTRLGVDSIEDLPQITKLIVSSPSGAILKSDLDSGGFGISRYKLDNKLADIARSAGVKVCEQTKVTNVTFKKDLLTVSAGTKNINCKVVAGTFGKRSNLDVKWNRSFIKEKNNKLNNYVGIKYHIITNHAADTIALHNFNNGYCGISQIEDKKYCLCYLTKAQNLKDNNNSIPELEKNVLYKNPHLKEIFTTSKFLFESPVTISQISFQNKKLIEDHILMIGDAAGMITPLCGNGMSMAMHGSKIAFECINDFLQNKISRTQMEATYQTRWSKQFSGRLRFGRILQSIFGKDRMTNIFIGLIKKIPFLKKKLIRATHGQPF